MNLKKSISLVLTLCMVFSLFATFVFPVAAEDAPTYTLIDTVDGLTSGTYYMSGVVDTTYHVFTGSIGSGDLYTSAYAYTDGALSTEESYLAVAVEVAAVEGKENTYTLYVADKGYISCTDATNNRKLAFSDTAAEWVASANANGGINLGITVDGATAYMGTNSSANSKLIRQYKETSSANALTYGVVFFAEVVEEAAPVTSQVVDNWNVANWNDGLNTSNGAYIFTDAELYASTTAFSWWRHVAFAPTDVEGTYEVTAVANGEGGEASPLTIPENGFAWVAFEWAESGAGAYAHAVMATLAVGDKVTFTGLDIANQTTTADATAEKVVVVPEVEEYKISVSHVNAYSWGEFNSFVLTGEGNNCVTATTYDCAWWIAIKVDLVDGVYTVTGIEAAGEAKVNTCSADGFIVYTFGNDAESFEAAGLVEVGDVLLASDVDLATDIASETPIGTMTFGPVVEDEESTYPDGYIVVNGENGSWQSENATSDLEYAYNWVVDGDNLVVTVIVNDELVGITEGANANGTGTNIRLWVNYGAAKWDRLYDGFILNDVASLYSKNSAGVEGTTGAIALEDKTFTFTLPLAEASGGNAEFQFTICVSNTDADGANNACLYAPCDTFAWSAWDSANTHTVTWEVPVPAPEAGADLPENLTALGSPYGDLSVLLDGYTGVGEITTYDGNQAKFFGISNAGFDKTEYSFTVVFDEEKTFNTVSIYALDFYDGCVHNPAELTVVIDGVEYAVEVGTNPGGISESVASLGEAVTAKAITVKVVMGASDQAYAPFNMFTEVAVSTVEDGPNKVEGGALPVFNPFMGTTIPANTEITYTVEFADGAFLSLYDPAVTVLVNGEAFEGAADLKYGDKVTIINEAAEDVAVFPRVVPVIIGSYNNPIEITASGDYTAVVNDLIIENSNGTVFFVYKSEIFGTLTVTMPSGNWFYNIYNETTGKYGDNHYSDDETVVSSETFLVSPGDVIMIAVSTYDPANPWSAPLGELTFNVAITETAKLDDRFGAPEVLFDGYHGVGEITGYEDHMDKLLAFNYLVANGQYTFSVTYEEMVAFDKITLYTLDYANGCVVLPESVVFVVNGVEYEAVITPNEKGIATVEVALDAAVVANEITVIVTTDGNAGWFNAFSEFTVNEVAMVSVPDGYGSLDVLFDGYTGVDEIIGYEGNQSKLFALMNNFNATSKYTVTVTLAEGTVYDGITFYALDYANGCILMPDAIEVTVDGETYSAYPWTQSEVGGDGFISEIVIDFDKEYSATEITVTITVPYSQYFFSMFTEVALHVVEEEPVTGNVIVPDGWGTVDVLIDGYTGVGEITAHDNNHAALVPFKNADTTVDTPYSFIVPLAEATSFNTVTVYALSHTNGHVSLPKTLSVTINGKTYEAAVVTGDDASVVAIVVDLGETVEADKLTVNATIAAGDNKYNAFSEVEVSTATPKAPDVVDVLISHNSNFNWNTYEGNLIAALPNADNKICEVAGDVTYFGSGTVEAESGLYVVEKVDGLYVITEYVTGLDAMKATAIPEGGFLYFVCSGNSDWDTVKGGAILGYIFNLNDIDINSKAAIDTTANPAMVATLVNPEALKVGDVNMNGKIDATDYATIRKLVIGAADPADFSELALTLADVNGNGKIDANDYILVKRHFLGTYTIPAWAESTEE